LFLPVSPFPAEFRTKFCMHFFSLTLQFISRPFHFPCPDHISDYLNNSFYN
jgi:hypothetical protein